MQKTKLFLIQFLYLILMAAGSLEAAAQMKSTVTVNLEDVTVLEVLKSIEKDTDYAFFYNNSDIDVSRVVSVSLKDASVEKVVSYILPGCVCRG